MISSGTSGMLSDSGSILRVHWSVCVCKGWSGLARRSVWDHLAWLAYMWQVTGAGVMKANLRPVDRMPCVGVGGEEQSRVPGSWLSLNTRKIIAGSANCWLLHLSTLSPDSSFSSSLPPSSFTLTPYTLKDGQQRRQHT